MTTRTRYFVIASLLVLVVGIGTGLVAYYIGLPTDAATQAERVDDLRLVPGNATLIAFANVQDIMVSDVRQRLLRVLPMQGAGQREFQDHTGINIETDIDRVLAVVTPPAIGSERPASGVVLARGRFDVVRIETLMREHGATVEDYRGTRVLAGEERFSVAFPEPGLAAVGDTESVRQAIDLETGGDSILANDEIMNLVRSIDAGNMWAVGRFDSLTAQARLPQDVAGKLPAITWFTASAFINGGFRGVLRAEARDEESATALRDVVRGFLALAKLQTTERPDLQTLLQSLELGGAGTTVALSFDLPLPLFDLLFPAPVPAAPQ